MEDVGRVRYRDVRMLHLNGNVGGVEKGSGDPRKGLEWVKERVELMRERYESGLDLWTGEPLESD